MDENQEKQKELTRRKFLKMVGGIGVAGASTSLMGCEHFDKTIAGDGWVPDQYYTNKNWPAQVRGRIAINPDSVSLDRNDELCILCGQCIEACRSVMSVFEYYKLPIINDVICVDCGQCILWCPTKSLTEKDPIDEVMEALADPDKFVVVQTAPATRVGLGEEFGLPMGSWVEGQQVAALKELGFDRAFDTNTGADFTILEEVAEFVKIFTGKKDKPLPLVTSCCPAWYHFCEYWYPDLLDHISSAGTPMQMLGSLVKSYYAKVNNIDPEKIYMVAIMPCTAKKAEAKRPAMNASGLYHGKEHIMDNDAVLTVRELARMIKKAEIDLPSLPEKNYDPILGKSSGAGLIFGATGGVIEAAARTAYYVVAKERAPEILFNWQPVRELQGVKETTIEIPGAGVLRIAVVHGLSNTREIMTAMCKAKDGDVPRYHLVEVMACPGGCVGGGGMPFSSLPPSDEMLEKRKKTIYEHDAGMELRESHENPEVIAVYEEFLGYPLSPKAYKLLHPHIPKTREASIRAINHRRSAEKDTA